MPKIVATVTEQSIDVTKDGEHIGSYPSEHPESPWYAVEAVFRHHLAESFAVVVEKTGQRFGVITRNP
jgi:hypothetical protein